MSEEGWFGNKEGGGGRKFQYSVTPSLPLTPETIRCRDLNLGSKGEGPILWTDIW